MRGETVLLNQLRNPQQLVEVMEQFLECVGQEIFRKLVIKLA